VVDHPGDNSVADFYRAGGYATDLEISGQVQATRGLMDDDAYVPYAQRIVDRCHQLGWAGPSPSPSPS